MFCMVASQPRFIEKSAAKYLFFVAPKRYVRMHRCIMCQLVSWLLYRLPNLGQRMYILYPQHVDNCVDKYSKYLQNHVLYSVALA